VYGSERDGRQVQKLERFVATRFTLDGVRVRFYGVRGSIAVPGERTARYGGNTVCVEARLADGSVVILDGGTGLRELGKNLIREEVSRMHILLTHLHWDHIMGIPFFQPVYQKDAHLIVHPMWTADQRRLIKERILFDGVHFPVRAADIPSTIEFLDTCGPSFRIGSATVRRVALNHPGSAQGFRVDDDDGSSLAYLTDNELSARDMVTTVDDLARFAARVDLLVHDAQYVATEMPAKQGWGHSTVDEALVLAHKAETPHLVLFHHDPDHDDDMLDAVGVSANSWMWAHAPETRVTVAREGLVIDPRASSPKIADPGG
jgi:phosphoribosyl 1,2-cyclic phosphodiesterase